MHTLIMLKSWILLIQSCHSKKPGSKIKSKLKNWLNKLRAFKLVKILVSKLKKKKKTLHKDETKYSIFYSTQSRKQWFIAQTLIVYLDQSIVPIWQNTNKKQNQAKGLDWTIDSMKKTKKWRKNSINISVFGYENKEKFPFYAWKNTFKRHVDLRVQLNFFKCCHENYCQVILQWPCVGCWRKEIFF